MPALTRHPDTPCAAVAHIDASVIWEPLETLTLYFALTGDIRGVAIPPRITQARADELWERTCLEAFIRTPSGGYLEFNLSPSSEWAGYEFTSYRAGMRALEVAAPKIDCRIDAARLMLRAELDFSGSLDLIAGPVLTLALSAVIEEAGGAKSYWALRHPHGEPDFHHADSFILDLARPAIIQSESS